MRRVLLSIALRRGAATCAHLLWGEPETEPGTESETDEKPQVSDYAAPVPLDGPPVLVLATNGDRAAELTMTSLAEGTGYGVAE